MIRTAVLSLLLLAPLFAWAQPPGRPSVFVDSEPLGAWIAIDGVLRPERTPTLLRDLSPGSHRIEVGKDGYLTLVRTVSVGEGVPVTALNLPPASVVLAFPGTRTLISPDGQSASGRQFRFSPGLYDLTPAEDSLGVLPVFPDEALLSTAGWSLALLAASATAATASDIWHIRTGWAEHPSNLTLGLWVSSVLDLTWYLSVQGRKARFVRETAPLRTPGPEFPDLAADLFLQGEDSLLSGDLETAAAAFGRLVRESPESRLVPGAWFRLARIHAVTGRRDLAVGEYLLAAETYPQAEYHDRARKALADLLEAAGDPVQALRHLESMVLTDGFFDPADIETQKARLTREAPVAP